MYWDRTTGKVKSNIEEELAMDLAQWTGLGDFKENLEFEEDIQETVKFNIEL